MVMNSEDGKSGIRKKAMDLLARREHSVQELRGKLAARGYDVDAIDTTLGELVAERLLLRAAPRWGRVPRGLAPT